MKLHPYIIMGIFSKIWTTYAVIEGRAEIHKYLPWPWKSGEESIRVHGNNFNVKVERKGLRSFGLGDITMTVSGGSQVWRNVRNVEYVASELKKVADGTRSSVRSDSGTPSIFRTSNGVVRSPRLITEAKRLVAFALLDGGRSIITSEDYGDHGACLAIYDPHSMELRKELVFVEGFWKPTSLTVISDPDRVLIEAEGGLHIIDLASSMRMGQVIPMNYYNDPIWALGRKKSRFWCSHVGIFNDGKLAAVHCGIAAHSGMPDNLITIDLPSCSKRVGPVRTPEGGARETYTDDMAGVPDVRRGQFITGNYSGWVHIWNVDNLALDRKWRIESPKGMPTDAPQGRANNEIQTMAISENGRTIALGTGCSAIHVVHIESGRDIIPPLVPLEYQDGENEWFTYSEVVSLQFLSQGKRLIAGYCDGTLRVWDIATGNQVGDSLTEGEDVKCAYQLGLLCVVPQANKVLTATSARSGNGGIPWSVRCWDINEYL